MNWFERQALRYVLRRLEGMMGTGWKGRLGAIGVILGALAGLATAYGSGTLSLEQVIAAFTVASGGLSAFGIRQAIGTPAPPTT